MKKLFLALPILLASCQSERVAFQFQPAPPTEKITHPARTLATTQASVAAEVTTPAAAGAGVERPAASETVSGGGYQHGPARRLPAGRPAAVAPLAAAATFDGPAATTPARPKLPRLSVLRQLRRQHATTGPARTAESGLGGIALFFIAIVLGVLVGLGALVSLIPGVSLLGGIGLAAAGLLVIFLLYSLLSGGNKK